MQEKSKKTIPVLAFQLCVVANSVFGNDAELYTLSKWIIFVFFAVMALYMLVSGGKVKIGPMMIIPTVFTVYSMLTYFWAYDPGVVTSQMVTQVQLFVLLVFTYCVMRTGGTIKDYLDALYIAGFGMAIFAMVRYGGIGNYIAAMEEGYRMGDEITNQNTYGMLFSNAAICAAYYVINGKGKKHVFSILLFTFFALSSGSRKAALMIVGGIFCLALLRYGFKKIYKTLLVTAVLLGVAVVLLQLPIFENIRMRLGDFFGAGNRSDAVRKGMVSYGLELFRQKPFFGYGLNNFRKLHYIGTYSHNNYIELLVGGGIVGTVMYYLMYLLPGCMLLFGKRRKYCFHNGSYTMILVWIALDLVFGWGWVQLYDKTAWIFLGVLLAVADGLRGEANALPAVPEAAAD